VPTDALINLTVAAAAAAAICAVLAGCAIAVHHQNHPKGHQ
jgi:hypothetical protein